MAELGGASARLVCQGLCDLGLHMVAILLIVDLPVREVCRRAWMLRHDFLARLEDLDLTIFIHNAVEGLL